MSNMKIIKLIGYCSSLLTFILWIILVWFNPYVEGMNQDGILISLIVLVFPALLFVFGLFLSRSMFLLISFIWSFPYSLYMLFTPSIFLLFGVTNLIYLLCFVSFRVNKIR